MLSEGQNTRRPLGRHPGKLPPSFHRCRPFLWVWPDKNWIPGADLAASASRHLQNLYNGDPNNCYHKCFKAAESEPPQTVNCRRVSQHSLIGTDLIGEDSAAKKMRTGGGLFFPAHRGLDYGTFKALTSCCCRKGCTSPAGGSKYQIPFVNSASLYLAPR